MSEHNNDASLEESLTTRTGTMPSADASADPAADRARWGDIDPAPTGRDRVRDLFRFAAGGVMLSALVILPRVELGEHVEGGALEVAIRTTAGMVEHCRKQTEEELAALPAHMRRPEVCTFEVVPYALDVDVDGERVVGEVFQSSGIHGDRPITVSRRVAVEQGTHRVRVRFYPKPAGDLPDRTELAQYEFDGDVEFAAGRVRLAVLTQATSGFELR